MQTLSGSNSMSSIDKAMRILGKNMNAYEVSDICATPDSENDENLLPHRKSRKIRKKKTHPAARFSS